MGLVLFSTGLLAEDSSEGLRELTPEELERYEFEIEETQVTVGDLSIGQRYVLSSQRREVSDLIARRLGVLKLHGNKRDLKVLGDLVDRKVLNKSQVREWQAVGVVFGDILAHEFGLDWVSYEDDIGVSKALRWRKTENYVFPVTMFSKRNQFNEKIDVYAVFDKIAADVDRFKAFEQNRPKFE
jgi:hypothetical protein